MDVQESTWDERSLIRQAKVDTNAFGPLYDRYYARVYTYLYRRCGHDTLAEDLTADTFLKAMRGMPSYKNGKAPFLGWLYRIAHNCLISHYRKEKVRELFGINQRKDKEIGSPAKPNTIQAMDMDIAGHRISDLISLLNSRDQFILSLRYFEDVSIKDIAAIMGTSVTAARTNLHRALQRLRTKIQREAPELESLIDGRAST